MHGSLRRIGWASVLGGLGLVHAGCPAEAPGVGTNPPTRSDSDTDPFGTTADVLGTTSTSGTSESLRGDDESAETSSGEASTRGSTASPDESLESSSTDSGDAGSSTTCCDASSDASSEASSTSSAPVPVLTAHADAYWTPVDEPLVRVARVGLTRNDVDPDGLAAVVPEDELQTALGGVVDIDARGAFTYVPPAGLWGEDRFSYTLTDGTSTSTAEVRIVVAPTVLPLARVAEGWGGVAIDGAQAGDRVGLVARGGDVNGDGFADTLISAPQGGPDDAGVVYVLYGGGDALDVPRSLAEVAEGVGGFAVQGDAPEERLGEAIAGAGDVDGDGRSDLVIGAPRSGASGAGRAYVLYAPEDDPGPVRGLGDALASDGGWWFEGEAGSNALGSAVAGVGDFDGDGSPDVWIGAPLYGFNALAYRGRAYLLRGRGSVVPSAAAGALANAAMTVTGSQGNALLGDGLAPAGDLDGDGRVELLLPLPSARRALVLFGSGNLASRTSDALVAGEGGFTIDAGEVDITIDVACGVGDVDGDGYDDVIVAGVQRLAAGHFVHRGYVVRGGTHLDGRPIALSSLDAEGTGFAIVGEYDDTPRASLGSPVVGAAGDVDGDGRADLLFAIPSLDPVGPAIAGRTYVVYGRASVAPVNLSDVAEGDGGFAIDGEVLGDRAGARVAGVGDVDGDGLDDVAIAAPNADFAGADAGRVYLVYGFRSR